MKGHMYLGIYFIPFLMGLGIKVYANHELQWAHQQLSNSLLIYEDKAGDQTVESIMNLPDQNFSKGSIHQNFGFTTSAWWMKFELTNKEAKDVSAFFRIANGHIHKLDFYVVNGDEILNQKAGNYYPHQNKTLQFSDYLFPLNIKNSQKTTYFLRLEKKGAELNAPISILKGDFDYAGIYNKWNLLFGGVFLYIMVIIFCALIIRTKVTAYYMIYVICISIYMATIKGISSELLWPNNPWIQTNALELSKHLAYIFYILFILNFVGWNKEFPIINKFLKATIGLVALNIFIRLIYSTSTLIPVNFMMRFVQLTAIFLPLSNFLLIYLLYQDWKSSGKREVLGLLVITFGLVFPLSFLVALHFGLIAALPLYPNLLVIMFLLEIFLISVMIVYRYYNFYKKEINYNKEISTLRKIAVENILLGQEEERIRIAKDIHDGISLSLANIRMRLSAIEAQVPLPHKKSIGDMVFQIGRTAQDVRNISHNLAPLSLQHQELTGAIEELIYQIELVNANMDIEFNYSENINTSLSQIHKQNVYQTVNEIFNNILKYAEASRIRIKLLLLQNQLQLDIDDDGIIYNPDLKLNGANSLGLLSIRSRATLLNGQFVILPKEEGGMLHRLCIPISS